MREAHLVLFSKKGLAYDLIYFSLHWNLIRHLCTVTSTPMLKDCSVILEDNCPTQILVLLHVMFILGSIELEELGDPGESR